MKFIATADWQLGMTAHYLDDEARARYQQARFDVLERIGEVAEEQVAAFVVVGGDVFESNQLDRAVVARTFEALRSIAVPVVIVPGNHDPLDAASIYDSPIFERQQPAHVHVLRSTEPYEVVPGVEIVGAPWHSKRPLEDLVAAALAPLQPTTDRVARVLVGHGAASTLAPEPDAPSVIDVTTLCAALDDGRLHFAVLGDKHSLTEVAPRVWYPGTPEVTARREPDPGHVLAVSLPDGSVESIRVGRWQFLTVEDQLDSLEDVERFAARLDEMPDKSRTALWLVLRGALSTAAHARLEDVVADAGALFARIGFWARHTDLAVVPDDEDFSGLGLSGFGADAVEELRAVAGSDGPDAGTAQGALALLYRLAGGAR